MLQKKYYIPLLSILMLASCGSSPKDLASSSYYDSNKLKYEKQKVGKPYQIKGQWYKPKYSENYSETGIASWYGDYFHGRKTANGEIFNMNKISAAHKTLPLPSYVTVTNLDNGRTLYVRVNDRGPFADSRIIDMSKAAAKALGFKGKGLARVQVKQVKPPQNVVLVSPTGKKVVGHAHRSYAQVNGLPNKSENTTIRTVSIDAPIRAGGELPLYNKDLFTTQSSQGAAATNPSIVTARNNPISSNPQSGYIQADNNIVTASIDSPAPSDASISNIIQEYNSSKTYGLSGNSNILPQNITPSQIISSTMPVADNAAYKIKLGVFSDAKNIQNLEKTVNAYGQVSISPYYKNGKKLSAVDLGPYDNLGQAQKTAQSLEEIGINNVGITQN